MVKVKRLNQGKNVNITGNRTYKLTPTTTYMLIYQNFTTFFNNTLINGYKYTFQYGSHDSQKRF